MVNLTVHDANAREFLHKFLGTTEYCQDSVEACQGLVELRQSRNSPNAHILQAAQVIFRYRLLDIYADALGIPSYHDLAVVPRMARPSVSVGRLDKVCLNFIILCLLTASKMFDRLSDWRQPILEFQKMYHSHDHVVTTPHPDVSMNGPDSGRDHNHFLAGVQCLMKYGEFQKKKNFNKILANIMALSFCIWWMSTVCGCSYFPFYSSGPVIRWPGLPGLSTRPTCAYGMHY